MDTTSQQLLIQGFSAFAGAFFAFLFLRLSEFLTKIYQREVKHYNSLVILETQLNEIGGIIHDNIYILPNFRRVITSGNIYFNNLHTLPIDKSHYENLHDLDLINDLFSYFYQLRKINDDIETSTSGYIDIKNALIQKNITPQDYKVNSNLLAQNLVYIEVFLKDLEERTIKLMARIRVQIKKEIPLGTRIQQFFIRTTEGKLNSGDIKKETEKLRKEIEATKAQSQKEIEAALKKHKIQ
ncbi:MAG: hypothetical protein US60_C0022G0007 [Microgenomates group bacterium GW2011_GWC1_37_8]|uniref:Uncharacterized protein n=1 Tax=Candidatus Woesebacteria bacterium GW2011_GWB1_38_8 TaxID=1618570 RepID=A0A0G0NID3_9BACT|nr:MAG: hypothetical protein US60_C0022G0007 [Microgenomates group bacterium GW2011_GWC1_37_8]KKQ85634.1 MAG: hypothetical protein UT08_C0005G0085 [Candidatus Woesebacteria bacterium GW2011_GWB1_38_8]